MIVVIGTAFVDSRGDAFQALAVLEECPARDRSLSREVNRGMTFEELYEGEDAVWPEGHRYAADNLWLNADPGDVLAGLRAQIAHAPSPESLVLVVLPPAPPEDTKHPDMAFSMLGRTLVGCYSVWQDEADDEANIGWLRDTMATLAPFGVGHYVAEAELFADPSRAARSFSPATWERLTSLRQRLDPLSLFHGYLGLD